MAYQIEVQPGQQLLIENIGSQTVITLTSSGLGQQQQSSQSVHTGTWTAPPTAYRTASGVIIHMQTTEGDRTLAIQQNQIQMTSGTSPISGRPVSMQESAAPSTSPMPSMEPMKPMKPMEPMKPMGTLKMGNMQMSMNPMEMQMGDMKLSMNTPEADESTPASTRRFCTQCGTQVKPSDRFCGHCGHQL